MPFCQLLHAKQKAVFTSTTINAKLLSTGAKNTTAIQAVLQPTFLALCSEMTQNHSLKLYV